MDLLYAIMLGVSTVPLKGVFRCTLKGYAGFPYKHSGTLLGGRKHIALDGPIALSLQAFLSHAFFLSIKEKWNSLN